MITNNEARESIGALVKPEKIQHPLRTIPERIDFIKVAFILYVVFFVPAVIFVLAWLRFMMKQELKVGYYLTLVTSILIFFGLGFELSFHRYAAKKEPLNYVLFALNVIFFSIATGALCSLIGRVTLIFLLYLLFNAIGLLIYASIPKDSFKALHAVAFGLGAVLIPMIFCLFTYRKFVVSICVSLLVIALLSIFIAFSIQKLVMNLQYILVPDDMIAVSARLTTLLPLASIWLVKHSDFDNQIDDNTNNNGLITEGNKNAREEQENIIQAADI